jgi:hypothetical protein
MIGAKMALLAAGFWSLDAQFLAGRGSSCRSESATAIQGKDTDCFGPPVAIS